MNKEKLRKANKLKEHIGHLDRFIFACEYNYRIKFYREKGIMATVHDYMREPELFELTPTMKDKFIQILKEEKLGLEKQFNELF